MRVFFGQFIALFVLFVIFAPVERMFALRQEQKIFRKGWRTDILHFLFNRFLVDVGSFLAVVILAVLFHRFVNSEFQTAVAAQPFLLQFIEAILIVNVGAYFAHRLAHTIPFWWKFHAVHHSSDQLDWLASARLHPLDQVFSRAIAFVPLFIFGFTREVFGAYIFLALAQGIFNHSNVRFRFGFFKWIITTPEYHHWHHSNDPAARNKNFAGQFPVLDLIFGTMYLPEDKRPETYGTDDPVPNGYLAQLRYPFRKVSSER